MQTFWQVAFYVVICLSLVCIPIQHRALNRIAFGRSMFITYTAIVMAYLVGVLSRSVPADIIAVLLLVLGLCMLVFMAAKSLQHMRRRAKNKDAATRHSAS
ncbi:MAG: hypothetical protein K6T78_16090 [Alicyclobacillus sp.]|nr:hypothetical protein [Alicyclobacillus sp.]